MNAIQNAATPSVRTRHSRLGISAFVIGLIVIVLFVFMFLAAMGLGLEAQRQGHKLDPHSAAAIALGLLVMLIGLLALPGLGLGLAGTMQKTRKRLFGVIGLCLNGGVVLLVAILMMIGFAAR